MVSPNPVYGTTVSPLMVWKGVPRYIRSGPVTTRFHTMPPKGVTSYTSMGPIDPRNPSLVPNVTIVLPLIMRRAELMIEA